MAPTAGGQPADGPVAPLCRVRGFCSKSDATAVSFPGDSCARPVLGVPSSHPKRTQRASELEIGTPGETSYCS